MGSQKSQEATALISSFEPNQYSVLQSKGEWQLWEDRVSTRRYMVFPLEDAGISEHNMQIYHFRKLNRAYLPGVHAISHDESPLCAHPQPPLLMLEYLPYTLAQYGRCLNLREGLTVLQAALVGYRIMSYLFGPLKSSPEMIRFTEAGVPKVWANQQLQKNIPSSIALEQEPVEEPNGRLVLPSLGIAEKRVNSIRSIIHTVSSALIYPFPDEIVRSFSRVRSYEEAEQAVESFCRRQGIELQEWIDSRLLQDKRVLMPMTNGAFQLKKSSENPMNHPKSFNSTLVTANQNINNHQYHQPIHNVPHIQQPIPKHTQSKPVVYSRLAIQSPAVHLPQIQSISQSKVIVQPIVTQTIIIQQLKRPPTLQSAKISMEDKTTTVVTDHKEPVLNLKPNLDQMKEESKSVFIENSHQLEQNEIPVTKDMPIASSEQSQSSHEEEPQQEENYKLLVHDVTDQSQNNEEASHQSIDMEKVESNRVVTPEAAAKEEIDLWQESMQKLSKRIISQQSSEYRRSQERDFVPILESHKENTKKDITDYKSQEELEKYIRNKYKHYFTDNEVPKKNINHKHTNSLDRQLYEKKASFASEVPVQMEEDEVSPIETATFDIKPSFTSMKKYTFGKIQSQYSLKAAQYQQGSTGNDVSYGTITKKQDRRRKNTEDDSINARYSKYVINRAGKNQIRNQQTKSQFKREREKDNDYNELRRILNQ